MREIGKTRWGVSFILGAAIILGAATVSAATVTNATLKANSSGVVEFATNVVCQADTTLAFNFTERRTAPCLAFNSEAAGNTMPTALNVRICSSAKPDKVNGIRKCYYGVFNLLYYNFVRGQTPA